MSRKQLVNIAASVHQKLLSQALLQRLDFMLILRRYGI